MSVAEARRKRINDVEVIPLTDLVRSSNLNIDSSLGKNDMNYLLLDVNSYEADSFIKDPIGKILDYATLAKKANKNLIIFNIGDVADYNLNVTKGYKALNHLGVSYTKNNLNKALKEYCN